MHVAFAPLAFIDALGSSEMMLIFVVVLLLFTASFSSKSGLGW